MMNKEQILCQHILEVAKSGIADSINGIKILNRFNDVYDWEQREQLKIIEEVLPEIYSQLSNIFWDKYSELDTDCEDDRQLALPLYTR